MVKFSFFVLKNLLSAKKIERSIEQKHKKDNVSKLVIAYATNE